MATRTPRRSRKSRRVLRSSRNHEPSSPPPHPTTRSPQPQSSPAHPSQLSDASPPSLPPPASGRRPDRPDSFSSSSNAPADHRDFSDRDWVIPSFVLPQNTSKRSKKLLSTSSDSRAAHANKLVDAPHWIASPSPPPPAASVPKPEAERKKLKVVPTLASASSTESTGPSSRRTADFKRSLLLVVVSHFTQLSVHSQLYC